MSKVTVACDTCGGLVKGTIAAVDGFTGGFYLRGWLVLPAKVTQVEVFPEGKNLLCDFCMQSSPEYQRIYGNKAALVAKPAPARMPKNGETVRSYKECVEFIKGGRWDD